MSAVCGDKQIGPPEVVLMRNASGADDGETAMHAFEPGRTAAATTAAAKFPLYPDSVTLKPSDVPAKILKRFDGELGYG